ncbi:MAG TPA: pitrilysin family protein [Thermoanaerobaculia bacterium]|nr:pitrilysin family protein [Thermoanaerobaculia bacterium]
MSVCTRFALLALLALSCVTAARAAEKPASGDIFPYKVHATRLENGLNVLAIPYDSPGTVAFFLVVRTGSRDEVEAGHSGFAHFFEHMMFRGTDRFPKEKFDETLKALGADSNASTSNDVTIYQIIGPSSALEQIMDIDADRFKNLKYNEEVFRIEAQAVLGEYNKNFANPILPMFEKTRDLAFQKHTYKHLTIGVLEDIKAMPTYYDYSLAFFDRFYRPENTTMVVVGDVQPQQVATLAQKYFGDWKKGYKAPQVPKEPPQTEAKKAHIDWPNQVLPSLMLSYHTPAFNTTTADTAALDLIQQLLTDSTSPLYQELVVEKQWVTSFSGGPEWSRDPYLFTFIAQVRSEDLLPKVKEAIDRHVAQLQNGVDPKRLDRIKSNLRYDFALGLTSPEAVAATVADAIGVAGDIQALNQLYAQIQKVTPQDVQRVAREVFHAKNETLVTLSHKAAPAGRPAAGGSTPGAQGTQGGAR